MPNKKGQKKKNAFNQTKKNFPQLKKVTDQKKTMYVSPYSIKAIHKPWLF